MFRPVAAALAAATLTLTAPPASAEHRRLIVGYHYLTGTNTVQLGFASYRTSGTGTWQTEFFCAVERLVTNTGRINSGRCQLWGYDPANGGYTTQGQSFPLTRWGEDNWATTAAMHSLPAAEDFKVCLRWTVLAGSTATTYEECTYRKLVVV